MLNVSKRQAPVRTSRARGPNGVDKYGGDFANLTMYDEVPGNDLCIEDFEEYVKLVYDIKSNYFY